jgi:WhiB family transcriptional regulator, redox-sensing transcriptional regulator
MTAPWLELTAAILRGVPRLEGVLCHRLTDLFDGGDEQDAREAAELCGHCPAREPCGQWANTLRHNQINGIIAGQHREWISHPSATRRNPTTNEGDQTSDN